MSAAVKTIQAAGVCALRQGITEREVLVVHRPRRDDWSLPKGKLEGSELAPVAAVRECREETGVRVRRLTAPLGTERYRVGDRPKQVRWWLADVDVEAPCKPLDPNEIDQAMWLPVTQALTRLDYPIERQVLKRGLAAPETVPLLVVRHAKAIDRAEWHDHDALRPLSPKGQRQANSLKRVLAAYGVSELFSSSATRCMSTFAPYAIALDVDTTPLSELSEEGADAAPDDVSATMLRLRDLALSTHITLAVCGHRPVLPAMADALDLPYDAMKPAEVLVAHLRLDSNGTRLVATERHRLHS